MKNNFLVTGATGFIGANLVRELVSLGQNVNVIVRDKKLNWRISDITDKINIFECDITDPKLQEIVDKIKPDYIFHLAGYGNLPHEDNIYKMVDINLKGTINLLNALSQNPFKLFINTGSSAEYGVKDQEMKESDVLSPINNYGVVKSAITLYCQKEAVRNNLPIINFRLFTPFGCFEGKNRLIPDVVLSALERRPIKVSSPDHVRDFVFVQDVVGAYMQAIKMQYNLGEIYNIGSGTHHSVKDIVEKILTITKSGSKIQWGAVEMQARYIEPKMWQADISKVKKILNWEPKNTIDSGLQKTVQWFMQHKNLYNQRKQYYDDSFDRR